VFIAYSHSFLGLLVANFAAYTFAPPILVTPLGALSVLIGAVLASFFLGEKLGRIGIAGCSLCLVGSVIIILHAPEDKVVETVDEILEYALQPGEPLTYYFLRLRCFNLTD
jgi:drug/metabolite transporter (DMT)-like permease